MVVNSASGGAWPVAQKSRATDWSSGDRDIELDGERYSWRKREEWEKIVDVPRMSGVSFALAMKVKNATDLVWLEAAGWAMRSDCDPGRCGPLPRARAWLARRVHDGEGRERTTSQRLVQRSGRVLLRGGAICPARARRCQRSPTNRCDMGGGAPDRRRGLRGAACDPRLPLWGLSSAPRSGSRSRRCGERFRALIPKANQQLPQFGRSRPRYATFRTG